MSGGCSLWVASFGSSRSASPAKRYLRWPKYSLPFSVWENERGRNHNPVTAAVSCRSARSLRCLCSTSIARTTDQSALTDGLRLAGSGQRFRPKGHRAIADMFCWLAARVALLWEMTHLCRNPQTVGRGSADGFSRVSSMALPVAPCCPWEDFPMQRYEAAVGWPRYSLPTG